MLSIKQRGDKSFPLWKQNGLLIFERFNMSPCHGENEKNQTICMKELLLSAGDRALIKCHQISI